MPNPQSLKLVIAFAGILVVAGVAYSGLKISRDGVGTETLNREPVGNEDPSDTEIKAEPSPLHRHSTVWSQKEVPDVDTSSWETYRNEDFGFQLKYPLTWDRVDTKSLTPGHTKVAVELASPTTREGSAVIVISISQDISPLSYLDSNGDVYSTREIIFNGYPAFEAWAGGHGSYYLIAFEANNRVYSLTVFGLSEQVGMSDIKRTILSTFSLDSSEERSH